MTPDSGDFKVHDEPVIARYGEFIRLRTCDSLCFEPVTPGKLPIAQPPSRGRPSDGLYSYSWCAASQTHSRCGSLPGSWSGWRRFGFSSFAARSSARASIWPTSNTQLAGTLRSRVPRGPFAKLDSSHTRPDSRTRASIRTIARSFVQSDTKIVSFMQLWPRCGHSHWNAD